MSFGANGLSQNLARAGLIRACGHELENLAEACAKIEGALGQAMAGNACEPTALVVELQDIDRVRQVLKNLGPFLRALADPAPGADLDEVVAKISLSDLRKRIKSDVEKDFLNRSERPNQSSQLGSIDWF